MDIEAFTNFIRDLEDLDYLDNFMNAEVMRLNSCANRQILPSMPKVRRKHFHPLVELGEYEFKQKYRFSKENMLKLIEIIRDDLEIERPPGRPSRSNQVPVEMQVLVAIRQWGANELPEVVANVHDITTHTLEKICRHVAGAFASKASRYIRMPATLAEKEQVTRNFYAIAAFPQVIGALTCRLLRLEKIIKPDQSPKESPITRCECLMNTQIISDSSFKIRDFDYRLRPLSSKSHNIFPETRIKERFEQHEFRGRLLLGDANYTCTNYLFTAFEVSQLATKKEALFNTAHACTQASVNKTLQLWRQRFRIIDRDMLSCTSFSGAKHLLVALAVLHNIAIDLNDSCAEFIDALSINEFIPDATFKEEPMKCDRNNEIEKSGAVSRSAFINKYF